ncbi:helix-turn-helix domain-containing protein [Streptomyces sp. NPDC048680]|uniref:TetR/AcrR family transcriptional regulator n=1 Tax=Streptomyces sp. NPDC048680 TaxID=3155492 RepID=UPI0034484A75
MSSSALFAAPPAREATVRTEKGTTASTEELAKIAGVGIGTVFRHFPTKEDLLAAIVAGRLRRLAAEAEALATAEDAGAAFFGFFTSFVEQSATKNTYADALADAGVDIKSATAEIGSSLRHALEILLPRAQEAGAVRGDIGVTTLLALLVGASRASAYAGWETPVQAKTLNVVLDGLRPPAGS